MRPGSDQQKFIGGYRRARVLAEIPLGRGPAGPKVGRIGITD